MHDCGRIERPSGASYRSAASLVGKIDRCGEVVLCDHRDNKKMSSFFVRLGCSRIASWKLCVSSQPLLSLRARPSSFPQLFADRPYTLVLEA